MRPCRSEGEGDERKEMKEERGMVKKVRKTWPSASEECRAASI